VQSGRRTFRQGQEYDCKYWDLTGNVGLEDLIDKNINKKIGMVEYFKGKTKEELKEYGYRDPDWYEKYPEDKYHPEYSKEAIEEFKKGVELIKQAQIYMQRIDWLLSGDDGEESFLKRLKEDLK
jgi:hypothetical protein